MKMTVTTSRKPLFQHHQSNPRNGNHLSKRLQSQALVALSLQGRTPACLKTVGLPVPQVHAAHWRSIHERHPYSKTVAFHYPQLLDHYQEHRITPHKSWCPLALRLSYLTDAFRWRQPLNHGVQHCITLTFTVSGTVIFSDA
jgi:hypothetical protein